MVAPNQMADGKAPLVSVVVPTFNRAKIVVVAIASALAQTYSPTEVVVVDDGSSDETEEKIRHDYGTDSRVRYVRKENGGPASARNFGFAYAHGDYVALLDSDDTWHPWKLSLQIRAMEKHPELGMTWTDMEMIDPAGQVLDPAYLRKMYSAFGRFAEEEIFPQSFPLEEIAPDLAPKLGQARLKTGQIFSKMVMGSLVHTSTVVLRRERLDRVRGFNEALRYTGEDYDFHLRTCREGPVGLLDVATIRYQQGMPDRLTTKKLQVHMAENALRTVEPVVEQDRAQIDLPDEVIRRRLAGLHAWIATERLDRGEAKVARQHFLKSLKLWPHQPELMKPLLFASLPFKSGVALRRGLQAIKGLGRTGKSSGGVGEA
jgi:GT2 family glycosyltransferase